MEPMMLGNGIPELWDREPLPWRKGPPGPSLGLAAAEDALATSWEARSLREVSQILELVNLDFRLAEAEVDGLRDMDAVLHGTLMTRLGAARGSLVDASSRIPPGTAGADTCRDAAP